MPFAIGAIAAPIIGGVIGSGQAQDSADAANNARKEALAQFANIALPDIEKQRLNLEQYTNLGTYNPELEALVNAQNTNLENVSLDPRLRNEQMRALESMSGIAESGMTPQDAAAFELARRNAAAEGEAKQQQILQNMQARGQGGSGAELMARLQSNQSGADRLQQAQLEEAAKKQQARMQALTQQANMAGSIRSQDYGQQTDLARAQDAINQFNTANSQSVNARNTSTKNQGQLNNLTRAQELANMNVNTRNQQQTSNKGLEQQQFQNQLSKAAGSSGQYAGMASANDKQAQNTAGMWGTIGQGVGTGIATLYGANNNKKPTT